LVSSACALADAAARQAMDSRDRCLPPFGFKSIDYGLGEELISTMWVADN
jgi:hypothetical protein